MEGLPPNRKVLTMSEENKSGTLVNVLPTKSRTTLMDTQANPNIGEKDVAYLIDHNDGLRIITASEPVDEFQVGTTVSVRHATKDFVIGKVEILAQRFLSNGKIEKDDRVQDDELERRLAHWAVR